MSGPKKLKKTVKNGESFYSSYMGKQYKFKSNEIENQIEHLSEKNITEFSIHDEAIAKDKKRVLRIINLIAQYAPEVYVNFYIEASVIDKEVVQAATQIFCSFDIPLECSQKGGKLLFDKKFYSNKAKLLNDFGLVFGFYMTYAVIPGDSQKNFMERLDFALMQYPNHIDFPQLENDCTEPPKVTGGFSAQEIRYCRDVAFACRTFYSAGRSVPWFLSVLKPLRIYPSKFFADFAEWQRCNNCDFKSGFVPENEKHKEIEKMQLLFVEEKLEEKNCDELKTLVDDVIRLNGAMARLAGEGLECEMETSYNPDDIFSDEIFDLNSFAENVCMMNCKVRIFAGEDGPDYAVI